MSDRYAAFTIRIKESLRDQIDARAKTMHRKRNGEIEYLLETALDLCLEQEVALTRRMRGETSEDAG